MAKAGRRYNKLVARFGSGILVTLSSNISTYAKVILCAQEIYRLQAERLEYRLPLHNEDAFEARSKLIAESMWAQNAKASSVDDLGRKIWESILSPFQGVLVKQKTLYKHDGKPQEHATCSRRSSENIGNSEPVLENRTENATRTALTEIQNVPGTDTSNKEPPISSSDLTRSQETLDADRDSEFCGDHGGASKPVLYLEGRNKTEGMLLLDSPTLDNFWYSFLEPLPIDTDFSSTLPLY